MTFKAPCPHCKRTNWSEDAVLNTTRPCQFCGTPFLYSNASEVAERRRAVLGIAGVVGAFLFWKGCLAVDPNACQACRGAGTQESTCFACAGHGYFGGVRCSSCGGGGKVKHTCRFCAGSGRKPAP